MSRAEQLVPYHFRQYLDGEFIFEEKATVDEALESLQFCDQSPNPPITSAIAWGRPGRSTVGNSKIDTVPDPIPRRTLNRLFFLGIISLGVMIILLLYLATR